MSESLPTTVRKTELISPAVCFLKNTNCYWLLLVTVIIITHAHAIVTCNRMYFVTCDMYLFHTFYMT